MCLTLRYYDSRLILNALVIAHSHAAKVFTFRIQVVIMVSHSQTQLNALPSTFRILVGIVKTESYPGQRKHIQNSRGDPGIIYEDIIL